MRTTFTMILLTGAMFAASSARAACDAPEYAGFDFWLGQWEVTTPDGKKAGTNRIEKHYDGCVITEHYSNQQGPYGTSLNIYDKTTDTWHQTWTDKSGLLLQLDGRRSGDQMRLSGKTLSKDGETLQHRIIWTKEDENTVIQHWEILRPNNADWQTLFKGRYTRMH